jgi:hypothetical protein
MRENSDLVDPDRIAGGSFTDLTDRLLPLFFDRDGRGCRRWEEVFGTLHPDPARRGTCFTVRIGRRSPKGESSRNEEQRRSPAS